MSVSGTPCFYDHYKLILCEDLLLKQAISNIHQLPTLKKAVLNYTSHSMTKSAMLLVPALVGFEFIAGQKSQKTKARKSVASFQVREKQPLGCKVTLRGKHLFAFLEKLVTITLPRDRVPSFVRDQMTSVQLGRASGLLTFSELEPFYQGFASLAGCTIHLESNSPKSISKPFYSGFMLLTA